jgi:hypothetical protein
MPPNVSPESVEDHIFSQFPGWTWFQRVRETNSWIWNEGYDIQRNTAYRWVCKRCVELAQPKITHFLATGLQNARKHLWRRHGVGAPDGQKKEAAQLNDEKNVSQPSIMRYFKLNVTERREQQIANTIISGFNKAYFRRLLVELIVTSNLPFAFVNNQIFRKILGYLNPLVHLQNALPTSPTLRTAIYKQYHKHHQHIVNILR